jgi:hypothetical protein
MDLNDPDLNNPAEARIAALAAITDPDLSLAVLRLANSALADVPSWLVLRVTEAGNEQPITIASPLYSSGAAHARSSLRVEVDSAVHDGLIHTFVFLAAEPRAFDAFRHFRSASESFDTDPAPGQDAGPTIRRLVVDGDMTDATAAVGTPDRDEPGDPGEHVIHQAIGVLLDRGWSDAGLELATRARAANLSLIQQARAVVDSLPG